MGVLLVTKLAPGVCCQYVEIEVLNDKVQQRLQVLNFLLGPSIILSVMRNTNINLSITMFIAAGPGCVYTQCCALPGCHHTIPASDRGAGLALVPRLLLVAVAKM